MVGDPLITGFENSAIIIYSDGVFDIFMAAVTLRLMVTRRILYEYCSTLILLIIGKSFRH